MSQKVCRHSPRAESHRARLEAILLPRLRPGCLVPTARFVGRLLGVDESTAGKHLRRMLRRAGIVTAKQRSGTGFRCVVVSIPSLEEAA
jgi:DNA-binding transcriptional ArsR family regulator